MRACLIFLCLLAGPALAEEWRSDGLCARGVVAPSVRLQLQRGEIFCAEAAGQPALRFTAGPKQDTVGKAALIVPFASRGPGSNVTVTAWLFLPEAELANSVILVDVECKRCGLRGNPGLRLYLRAGGFRVDRSKIGERHAWAVPDPPRLPQGRWVPFGWTLELGGAGDGTSEVTLDGEVVLTNRGRTLPRAGADSAVDRVQIGITANSNERPVTLFLRDIRIRVD